jgi:DNA polymerase III psi subunit
MFSNLTLYYLHHMGITPWVNKESLSHLNSQSGIIRLLIILPSALSVKAHSLFKAIVVFLDLKEEELLIINFNKQHELLNKKKWAVQFQQSTPLAALVFDADINNLLMTMDLSFPVEAVDLENLLQNPLYKKNVWQVLNQIKLLIT